MKNLMFGSPVKATIQGSREDRKNWIAPTGEQAFGPSRNYGCFLPNKIRATVTATLSCYTFFC